MAKILSKSTIVSLGIIRPWHVSQSIDAFAGTDAYDITLSGSMTITGSVAINGLSSSAQNNIITYNSSTGQLGFTASNAVGSGGSTSAAGNNFEVQFNSASVFQATSSLKFNYFSQSLEQGLLVVASGSYSHAEGGGTHASGTYSHAEGLANRAEGIADHAEGMYTTASSVGWDPGGWVAAAAHSEGDRTQALGIAAHAEGLYSKTSGSGCHAEGYGTLAQGRSSHAEGYITSASGQFSHAAGWATEAKGLAQSVIGIHNLPDETVASFIVGNGADANNKSNLIHASGSIVNITGSLWVSGSSPTYVFFGNSLQWSNPSASLVFSGSMNTTGSMGVTGSMNVTGSMGVTGSIIISGSGALINSSQTGSYVTNSQTGSFATNSQTGSFATTGSNNFSGSQTVTGSMTITGSLTVSGSQTFTNIGPFNQTGDSTFTGNTTCTGSMGVTGSLLLGQGSFSEDLIKVNNENFLSTLTGFYYVGNTNNTLQFIGQYVLFNNGHITASVNISSSANVIAKTGSFSHLQGNSPFTIGDQVTFQQPITASGNISGSLTSNLIIGGNVTAGRGHFSGFISASNELFVDGANFKMSNDLAVIKFKDKKVIERDPLLGNTAYGDTSIGTIIQGSTININNAVTASVNISSSATIFGNTGSFDILIGDGSTLTNLQRPISNSVILPFTASNSNSGYYFRAGGNVTCSIQSSSLVSCNIGNEFEIFQTSSAGYVLFLTGSGVTLNSKGGNIKLAGQFSAATLKKVGNDEWDLIGDLG